MKSALKLSVLVSALCLMNQVAIAGHVLKLNVGTIQTKEFVIANSNLLSTPEMNDFIVQFENKITEKDKTRLTSAGVEIFGYLPDDALVVRSTVNKLQQLSAGHFVVVPYKPSFKISSSFSAISVFNQNQNVKVLVKNFKAADLERVSQKLQALGASIINQDQKYILAVLPKGKLLQAASIYGVEHIQPATEMKTMHMVLSDDGDVMAEPSASGDYTDLTGNETGTKVMKMDQAWAKGYTGRGQIASMADTGLDTGDTKSIVSDFKEAVTNGYFFGMFSKSWEDPMGHGTHVAGSVVGRGTLSNGLIRGGAYEAEFVPESIWSPMLANLSLPSKLSDLFDRAYKDGARVHTNSWGGARDFGAYDAYASQVDDFMFHNQEMLILFAAGNSGVDANKDGRIDSNSMSSPGTAKDCLTVGASENVVSKGGIQVPISKLRSAKDSWSAEPIYSSYISDNENGIAMFSSRGPTSDGRTKPDIVAPGTNILSNRSHHKDAQDLWGKYNDDYVWSGGTSMATPLTAGAVTVARQIVAEKFHLTSPSGALMKAVMIHTADDMYPGQYGEMGEGRGQEILTHRPNSDEGYGRVDMANIAMLDDSTQLIDEKTGLAQGDKYEKTVKVGANGSILVNLVWTDAPGSPNANPSIVNDLDLELVKPNGQSVSMNDHINNHEVVELSGLASGNYIIRVKGTNVPQGLNGKQPFALVITTH